MEILHNSRDIQVAVMLTYIVHLITYKSKLMLRIIIKMQVYKYTARSAGYFDLDMVVLSAASLALYCSHMPGYS